MRSDNFSGGGVPSIWGNKKFVDPFLLNSNMWIPENFYTALDLALYLAIKNPLYTQAAKRTVAHFITDVDFVGNTGSSTERKDLKEYLHQDLCIFEALLTAGMEWFIYGNSFARLHFPFNRYLVDRRNGGYRQYAVNKFEPGSISYNAKNMTYRVPDPLTSHLPSEQRKMVDLEFIDRKSKDASRIRIRFLDPMRMRLNMNFASGTTEYIWQFDEFFRADVKTGTKIYQINETPMEMLRAIGNDEDFAFAPGSIFHFKNPFITGLSNNGWGIPNILLTYNSIHQLAVYHCINEAVGMDYLLPFRLLSPTPSSGGGGADVAAATNLGRWHAAMTQLIDSKRKDPTALHTVPFPVNYQEFGASGKSLAPVDLIKAQEDTVLNNMGFPAELWHSSLQYQQVPTALRSFQRTFANLQRSMDSFLRWCVKSILGYQGREQLGVKLEMPTMADDMEIKHIYMQLAAGGELSRETAYKAFNILDPLEEIKRRTQEDIETQKIKQKENENFEREMTLGSANQIVDAMLQAQGGSGGPPPPPPGGGGGGGGPMPGGGDGGAMTPLDLEQQGEELAQQWLQMDVGARRKEIAKVKATNPNLYAVAMRKMEDIRQQGASEGRKSVSNPQ